MNRSEYLSQFYKNNLNHEFDIIHDVCDGDAWGCDGEDVAITKVELNIIAIELRDNTIGGV